MHQKINSCCEAIHKEVKKFIFDKLEKNKESFFLEIAIENEIEFHKKRKIDSTVYKPKYLRNIDACRKIQLKAEIKIKNAFLILCYYYHQKSN